MAVQITPIGVALIPFGFLAAIATPRKLFAATLFFAPFSATAVLNVGSGLNASGVTVYVYFAILLFLRAIYDALINLRLVIPRTIGRPIGYLLLFVSVCAVSIIMPLWINGKLEIISPDLLDMTTTPLYFSSKNVTGVIYVFLGIFTATLVARRTLDPQEFRAAVRICTFSGLFVALWGLLQLACFLLHVPYPAFVFNSSATGSAQGFASTLGETGLRRLSSVAVEPSIMAASLLTILPLSLAAFAGDGYVVSRKGDKCFFGTMILVLFLSTSSTALIGLFLIGLVFARYLVKFRRLSVLWFVALLFFGIFFVGAYFFIPPVNTLLNFTLLSKAGGYSALERTKSIVYSFSYFLEYPVLGVGWASVTSHSAVVALLANCGLIGLGAFIILVGSVIARLLRRISAIKDGTQAFNSPALLLYIALVVALIIGAIDGLPYVFGYFWVLLGLAISAPSLNIDQTSFFRESAK